MPLREPFIVTRNVPHSIYEIEGANMCHRVPRLFENAASRHPLARSLWCHGA